MKHKLDPQHYLLKKKMILHFKLPKKKVIYDQTFTECATTYEKCILQNLFEQSIKSQK